MERTDVAISARLWHDPACPPAQTVSFLTNTASGDEPRGAILIASQTKCNTLAEKLIFFTFSTTQRNHSL
jgi:hypothetical protein